MDLAAYIYILMQTTGGVAPGGTASGGPTFDLVTLLVGGGGVALLKAVSDWHKAKQETKKIGSEIDQSEFQLLISKYRDIQEEWERKSKEEGQLIEGLKKRIEAIEASHNDVQLQLVRERMSALERESGLQRELKEALDRAERDRAEKHKCEEELVIIRQRIFALEQLIDRGVMSRLRSLTMDLKRHGLATDSDVELASAADPSASAESVKIEHNLDAPTLSEPVEIIDITPEGDPDG